MKLMTINIDMQAKLLATFKCLKFLGPLSLTLNIFQHPKKFNKSPQKNSQPSPKAYMNNCKLIYQVSQLTHIKKCKKVYFFSYNPLISNYNFTCNM